MPTAAVLSTQATTTHASSLYIRGGLDVLKEPGTLGTSFGAPIEDIKMTEAGPGGVSSMEFNIDDPLLAVKINDGDDVQFYDNTNSAMLFRGYVDHWSYVPAFGGQGRIVHVSAVGLEAWLDWIKCTVDAAQGSQGLTLDVSRTVVSNTSLLRSPMDSSWAAPLTRAGSFANPTGTTFVNGVTQQYLRIWDAPSVVGMTLREAINALYDNSDLWDNTFGHLDGAPALLFTVDFYFGFRLWEDFNTIQPDDYTTLTISDTPGGTYAAEALSLDVEPGDVIHEVYVKGLNAASSGLFSDGTGIRGRTEYIDDNTIADADTARRQALSLIATNAASVRGSFELTDWTPPATIHAGSLVTITDASVGLTATTYRIMQIDKGFNASGRQNWKISFGGMRPSGIRLLRRLTRDTQF